MKRLLKIIFTIQLVLFSNASFAAAWKKLYRSNVFVTPDATTCPSGYIGVPFLPPYTMRDFCVMKYEAKNDGYNWPVSVIANQPWNSITRTAARAKCKSLGSGHDLISNNQWQTIARNIAGVAQNWSGGIVANGELNRGHSDNAPAYLLAASADDVAGNCFNTGQICSSSVWDSQRRTHVLSNNNVIWDFAGNAWEWVTLETNVSNGATGYMSTLSGGDIRQTRFGALGSTICADPGSSPYCGMGHGDFAMGGVAVIRGGGEDEGVKTGIFTASSLNPAIPANPLTPAISNTDIGFRCVYVP